MNIIGRLTRDAEVGTTSQDKQVVSFSVATNESYRNKQGERIEQTTYFVCLLDNPERGKVTDQRHFGRTHRTCKHKSVGKQRGRAESRAKLPYLTNQTARR